MTIPPKCEDVVAKLDAALGREAELREELERVKSLYDREVLGLNNEGDPIGGDPAGGYKNDNVRLQQRLTVAERLLKRVIDSSVLSFERDAPEELESLEVDICAALKPAEGEGS